MYERARGPHNRCEPRLLPARVSRVPRRCAVFSGRAFESPSRRGVAVTAGTSRLCSAEMGKTSYRHPNIANISLMNHAIPTIAMSKLFFKCLKSSGLNYESICWKIEGKISISLPLLLFFINGNLATSKCSCGVFSRQNNVAVFDSPWRGVQFVVFP